MKLSIQHQEKYSRLELILRTFLGGFYIGIPHFFLMSFVLVWSCLLSFLAWFSILFIGKYPKAFFDSQLGFMRWNVRVAARMYNLCDGYPQFGINGKDEYTSLEIDYPEKLSRGDLIIKTMFNLALLFPHIILFNFRMIGFLIIYILSFWAVLFTGKYPKSWHEYSVGTLRWAMKLWVYMGLMSDEYPPFSAAKE